MKKRIKTKWLKALRSGEYKQGEDGVLPEDINPDGWEAAAIERGED